MDIKTTVEALKELYYSLGGEASAVADIEDINSMILKIAKLNLGHQPAELPAVTTTDNGKALMVSGGKWVASNITFPTELPAVTVEDDNDVLTVVSGAWAKAAAPVELPTVTGANDGQVLTVVDGAWAAAALPTQE